MINQWPLNLNAAASLTLPSVLVPSKHHPKAQAVLLGDQFASFWLYPKKSLQKGSTPPLQHNNGRVTVAVSVGEWVIKNARSI